MRRNRGLPAAPRRKHGKFPPFPSWTGRFPRLASSSRRTARKDRAAGIDHVVSSPFVRAVGTVRPFCQATGIELQIDRDLSERRLSGHWIRDFEGILGKTSEDFDFALPGGESSRACQQRVVRCISQLATAVRGQTLLVSSHGDAIALFLNSLDPAFGWPAWQAMRNPDLLRTRLKGARWETVVRL